MVLKRGKRRSPQVNSVEHYGASYLTLPRHILHWHQANEVATILPDGGSVLEIGPGAGYTTFLLRAWGLRVTTLDLDPKLGPDIVGDVASLGFADGAFDCVLAGQVLEHIPFDELRCALRELSRVTRRFVVITLPAPVVGLAALLNIPFFSPVGFVLGIPYRVRHQFDGQHYWELGKRGFGLKHVRSQIMEGRLRIIREFRPTPSLYCYFFVAEISNVDNDPRPE